MKIISFAYTTPSILAERKSVTRREWKDEYAIRFKEGEYLQAYNRSPRFGGKRVGTVKLIATPYLEQTQDMPDSDYEAEGFAYLDENPDLKSGPFKGVDLRTYFKAWQMYNNRIWVVRFEIVEIFK